MTNQSGTREPSFQLKVAFILGLIALLMSTVSMLLGLETGWSAWTKWIAFISAILLACVLFVVRSQFRLIYGLLEIAFAVFLIFQAIFTHDGPPDFSTENLAYLAQVAAGVYVFIRGLDNINQSRSKDRQF